MTRNSAPMRSRALGVAVLSLFALASWASAAPPFEKVVPDDTLLFLTVRNVPAFRTRIKQHPFYAIWQEPDVQRFLDKPLQHLTDEIQKGEEKAGVKFDEVLSLFHGQVALELRMAPGAQAPEYVWLVDVAGEGERALKLVSTLNAKQTGPQAPALVEETYEGAKLLTLRKPEAQGETGAEPVVTFGLAGDVLLIGAPEAAVKRTVTLLNSPPAAALASAPGYQAVLQKVSPDSDFIAFVNLAHLVELGQATSPSPRTGLILQTLGLKALGAAGLGISFGEDSISTRLFVQTPGEREGIVKILTPAPGPLHSGAEAPADVSDFVSLRFEPTAIWDAIEKVLGAASPDALTALNAKLNQAGQQLGQPFSLRNDVFALLGPRFAWYRRFDKPYNAANIQDVFMVDIASKAAFNAALDKINKVEPEILAMFQPQEYLGQQVYVWTPPAANGAPPPEGTPRAAFVATDRELILSPRLEALQAHLRRMSAGGPSLQDRPEFQDALKGLPQEDRTLIMFHDPVRPVEYTIAALREGGFSSIAGLFRGNPELAETLGLFDFSLLPDPAVVSKHLAPGASCAVVQPDGLLFVSRVGTRP